MSKEKEERYELDGIVDYFGTLESEAPSRKVRKKPVILPIHSDRWTKWLRSVLERDITASRNFVCV